MANKFVRRSALTDRVSSMMIDVSYAQVVAWEDGVGGVCVLCHMKRSFLIPTALAGPQRRRR